MQKLFEIIILIFFLVFNSFSQTREYKLLDKTNDADINHQLFVMLDTAKPGISLMENVFKPVSGKFVVYRLLLIYQGMSFTNKQKEFHDILIVKTNKDNKILDAYQYTLEWAEMPLDTDLFRSTNKNVYLTDEMSIDKFMFERIWDYDSNDRKLKDKAIIKLK